MSKRSVQAFVLTGLIVAIGACSSGGGSSGSKGTGGFGSLGGGSSGGSSGSSGSSSGSTAGSSGSSSGSSSGGQQTCTSTATDACNQCLAAQCCSSALGCDNDQTCAGALKNCGTACTTSKADCDACAQQANNALLNAFVSCGETSCASQCFGGSSGGGSGGGTSGTAQIGDSCSATKLCISGAACVQNNSGQDVFCTTTCSLNVDCGSASNGAQNVCVSTTSGEQLCAPSCETATCPAGSTCKQIPITGSSATISVCDPN